MSKYPHPIFRHYLEGEDDKPYYTMNSLSFYYEDMERKQKLIESLAKSIAGYDIRLTENLESIEQEVDKRLAEWDKQLETFPASVEDLLTKWTSDGTIDQVIQTALIDEKIAPVTAKLEETTDDLEGRGFNALSYGVRSDGVDSTSNFLNALQSIPDKSTLVLPPGTINLSNLDAIVLSKKLYIKGAGVGRTIIKGKPGQSLFSPANSFMLTDVTIEDAGTVVNFGTADTSLDYLLIERVHIKNCNALVIWDSAAINKTGKTTEEINDIGISNVFILNNVIESCTRGILLAPPKLENVFIDKNVLKNITNGRGIQLGDNNAYPNRTKYILTNNILDKIVRLGTADVQGILCFGMYAKIDNNFIKNVANGGGDSEGIYTKCAYTTITNNTLIDAGTKQGFINVKGANRQMVEDGVSASVAGHTAIVKGNLLRATKPSVEAWGISMANDNILTEGNILEGSFQYGIRVLLSGSRGKIANNYFQNIKKNGAFCGIYSSQASRLQVNGNVFESIESLDGGTIFGINLVGILGSVEIHNNTFSNFTTSSSDAIGVYIQSVDGFGNLRIKQNIFEALKKAMRFSGPLAYLSVTGNELRSVTVSKIQWGSGTPVTELILKDNIGFVTENSGSRETWAGLTSLTMTHGLDETPRLQDISITASTDIGSDNRMWISSPTATQFTVNFAVAVAAGVMVNWNIQKGAVGSRT